MQKGEKMSIEVRRIIAKRQTEWAAKNLLGHECYRKKTGWCVRVRAADYPDCTDCSGNKHLAGYNNEYKYIRRSYKNWLDAGNKMPDKDEVLFHIDGNWDNDTVENLMPVKKRLLATMSKKRRYTKNKDANLSYLKICEVEQKIRALKKGLIC